LITYYIESAKEIFLSLFIAGLSTFCTGQGPAPTMNSLTCLEKADAEKILGQPARITENTTEKTDSSAKYRCTYTADRTEASSGKLGHVYYMFETYRSENVSKKVYTQIFSQNASMPHLDTIKNLGDEALRHTDNENFDMIIVRKGNKIVRIKVNRLTKMTSAFELLVVAEKITASL